MAVFTEVSEDEAGALLRKLKLGELRALRGIQGGIENTNYFATAEGADGTREYVLTVFERLDFQQLPYYLHLMKHLAQHGIPVPDPAADARGEILHKIQGKPAAVVNRLPGHSELAPTAAHCAAVGDMLARLHLAARDYARQQPNLRGLPWWNETVPVVLPHLEPAQAQLLRSELAYQNHVAAGAAYAALPHGPIHADLFRDNVLFSADRVAGVIDFYFACTDALLYDVAIAVNDWCVNGDGSFDAPRIRAFLDAYAAVRRFTPEEQAAWPAMLRAGALRFWVSRLYDFHLPRAGELTHAKDPGHFRRILALRIRDQRVPPQLPT